MLDGAEQFDHPNTYDFKEKATAVRLCVSMLALNDNCCVKSDGAFRYACGQPLSVTLP